MYAAYFGLKSEPFSIAPDPRYLFMSERHREALAHLAPRRPLTYSAMHLMVAISVAFALTGDWRIALGVGVIEPMVQTVAYVFHERAWAMGTRKRSA